MRAPSSLRTSRISEPSRIHAPRPRFKSLSPNSPHEPESYTFLARSAEWQQKKLFDKAISDCSEATRLDPDNRFAAERRAWLLVTASDATLRDGKQAVESAMRACELTLWQSDRSLMTLAAAYAEDGNFDQAVKWQKEAIRFVGNEDTKKSYESLLKLYRDEKPYPRGEEP